MNLMAEQEVEQQLAPEPLKLADRCDRCGAQAFVRVTLPSGSQLEFCGHHYNEYEVTLITLGSEIQDERDKINHNPSSANGDI